MGHRTGSYKPLNIPLSPFIISFEIFCYVHVPEACNKTIDAMSVIIIPNVLFSLFLLLVCILPLRTTPGYSIDSPTILIIYFLMFSLVPHFR